MIKKALWVGWDWLSQVIGILRALLVLIRRERGGGVIFFLSFSFCRHLCNKNNAAATGHRDLFFLRDFATPHFLSYSSRSTCLFLSYPPPAATSQWEMQINKSSAVGKFPSVGFNQSGNAEMQQSRMYSMSSYQLVLLANILFSIINTYLQNSNTIWLNFQFCDQFAKLYILFLVPNYPGAKLSAFNSLKSLISIFCGLVDQEPKSKVLEAQNMRLVSSFICR